MSTCLPADRLLQTLSVDTPGATDAVIKLALYNTIDEFLKRTSAWRYPQQIELVEGVFEYPMDLPVDTMVVRVMQFMHQGRPVASAPVAGSGGAFSSVSTLVPELVFPDGDSTYKPVVIDGPPSGMFSYAIYRPLYVSIIGQPDVEARKFPVDVIYALTLAPACLECECGDWPLEEWMYDTYFHELVDGTLGRLMGMASKPWSDRTLAGYHLKRFRNGMALRKQEAVRGMIYDKPMWRFPGGW